MSKRSTAHEDSRAALAIACVDDSSLLRGRRNPNVECRQHGRDGTERDQCGAPQELTRNLLVLLSHHGIPDASHPR
jgi:hypothetical protein